MNLYTCFTENIVSDNECPFILENFDPKDKKSYIMVRINSRQLTDIERKELYDDGYLMPSTVGLVHVYKIYDVASAKIYLIDDNKPDPLTRQLVSQDIKNKIMYKFINRDYILDEYDGSDLFKIFCDYYGNNGNNGNNEIKYTDDEIKKMKCNLCPHNFNCFIDCDRKTAEQLLKDNDKTWLIRPSNVKSFDFIINDNKLKSCSTYYVLSYLVNNKCNHYLFEHAFGEGYYRCSGNYINEIPYVTRKQWYGCFVETLENIIGEINIHDYFIQ